MTVTVYSKPACPQCRATRRALDLAQVEYQVVDLSQDARALDEVVSMGHRQAPVVVAGAEHWSGYRPDRIAAVAALVAQAEHDAADAARLSAVRKAA
ncbi:MAG: glutaredoxin-like protein NrdH [Bifidobacteriaceae bacterium]|jgi:glutaredoxin-like protein NrdH|nr:glutaredoxin-like protein NrdH [Bifidobacteriaceae bacterium]